MKYKNIDTGLEQNQKIKELISKLEISDWNLSKEREFIENLFVGRFNYYLLIFSIFTTAGFANSFTTHKDIVFYFGALLLICCWIPLYRGFRKNDYILRVIFQKIENHPMNIIEEMMKLSGYNKNFIVTRWMGVYIPLLCIAFLIIVGIFINCKILY